MARDIGMLCGTWFRLKQSADEKNANAMHTLAIENSVIFSQTFKNSGPPGYKGSSELC